MDLEGLARAEVRRRSVRARSVHDLANACIVSVLGHPLSRMPNYDWETTAIHCLPTLLTYTSKCVVPNGELVAGPASCPRGTPPTVAESRTRSHVRRALEPFSRPLGWRRSDSPLSLSRRVPSLSLRWSSALRTSNGVGRAPDSPRIVTRARCTRGNVGGCPGPLAAGGERLERAAHQMLLRVVQRPPDRSSAS